MTDSEKLQAVQTRALHLSTVISWQEDPLIKALLKDVSYYLYEQEQQLSYSRQCKPLALVQSDLVRRWGKKLARHYVEQYGIYMIERVRIKLHHILDDPDSWKPVLVRKKQARKENNNDQL